MQKKKKKKEYKSVIDIEEERFWGDANRVSGMSFESRPCAIHITANIIAFDAAHSRGFAHHKKGVRPLPFFLIKREVELGWNCAVCLVCSGPDIYILFFRCAQRTSFNCIKGRETGIIYIHICICIQIYMYIYCV